MAQLNMIYFLLVVWTVFSISQSLPYPFYQHELCSVSNLNVSELVGDWHLIYHKDNLTQKVDTKMTLIENKTLLTSVQENGTLVNSFNLTQHDSLQGRLEVLVDRGSWVAAVPTFVLSVQPDQYLTVYQSKMDGPDDWAIYSRTNELSEENYLKAIQGLICLRLVDAKDGKPLLHKL